MFCVCVCMNAYTIHTSIFMCVYTHTVASFPPSSILILGISNDHRILVQGRLADFCTVSPLKPKSWGGYLSHPSDSHAPMPVGRENSLPSPRGTVPWGKPCGCQSQSDASLLIQPEQHSYLWCMGLNLYSWSSSFSFSLSTRMSS